ncbi:hypothetical protein AB0O16_02315 [Microbacterium sp. NPDC089180]|uniref:hypothetical protein n=1 Tax=unclassified Microbacterium TaxID=2609290 RepID=UPI0034165EE6
MNRAFIAVSGALLIAAAALLTGCVPEPPSPASTATVDSPSATAPSASPTGSASTPTPTPTAAPTAPTGIPKSCDDLGAAATRQQTVGGLTAQHADGFVRPAPANATTELSCNWIQEESAGVLLLISTASAAEVSTGVDGLDA